MKEKLIELYGWYGAGAIVCAYALVSFNILAVPSVWYQLLNLSGALGVVIVSFYKKTYQPAVLNLVWAVIAGGTLVRMLSYTA